MLSVYVALSTSVGHRARWCTSHFGSSHPKREACLLHLPEPINCSVRPRRFETETHQVRRYLERSWWQMRRNEDGNIYITFTCTLHLHYIYMYITSTLHWHRHSHDICISFSLQLHYIHITFTVHSHYIDIYRTYTLHVHYIYITMTHNDITLTLHWRHKYNTFTWH